MDSRIIIFSLILITHNCYCQDNNYNITDDEIFAIFSGLVNNSTTSTTGSVELQPTVNITTGMEQDCECVHYYQCNNHTIITNGEYLIDIRQSECDNYLDLCCSLPSIERNKTNTNMPGGTPRVIPSSTDTDLPSSCGIRNANGAAALRILGDDSTTQFGEFPWMVALFRVESSQGNQMHTNIYQCGGSLIHPRVVLTAAHCVSGRSKARGKQLIIRAGEWDTQTEDEMFPHQERNVQRIVIHPKHNPSTFFQDIALLLLDSPLELEQNIDTTCLPPKNFVPTDLNGCFATGWGKDKFGKDGEYQVILKKVELPIILARDCENALKKTNLTQRFFLHPSFLCAGGQGGNDVCTGDGGSPLVCPISGEEGRYHQVGIVSWGIGCGMEGVPGVYGNVAQMRDWIDQEMVKFGFSTNTYVI